MRYLNIYKSLMVLFALLINSKICNATSETLPQIVVSIKPFYNLVAAVTKDTCPLKLLVQGNSSPHYYTIKPSDLQTLTKANIIFWGGDNIEPSLKKIMHKYSKNIVVVDLSMFPGLEKKTIRSTSLNNTCMSTTAHAEHDFDPHIWLSIHNAKIIVANISIILSKYDPQNAPQYTANSTNFLRQLEQLDTQLKLKLANITHTPYIVLHDAYQYFEDHYSLHPTGAITLHPEIPPSIKHLQNIKDSIINDHVICIFSEPQIEPSYIKSLIKDTKIKHGILDPIGKDSDLGTNGYFILMENLSTNMLKCLQ